MRWPQRTATESNIEMKVPMASIYVPTPKGKILTQSDVAHNKIANVKRHHENQDQQNYAQVHFPVKITGAEIDIKGYHQDGKETATFILFSLPKDFLLFALTEYIPCNQSTRLLLSAHSQRIKNKVPEGTHNHLNLLKLSLIKMRSLVLYLYSEAIYNNIYQHILLHVQ